MKTPTPAKMKTIIIDPEFEALIPPLAPEELKQLHMSLCGDGCLSPLIVWQGNNVLVDGHNRYKYLTKNEMPFEVREIEFAHREEVKRFIILNQLGRRNVTPETASKLRAEYHESMSRGRGGDRKSEESKPHSEALISDDKKTAEVVAEQTGTSRATVERDVRLMKALDDLGISRNDYAAGNVRDKHGKKRTKKSIIEEAFPPKPKKAEKQVAQAAAEAAQPVPSMPTPEGEDATIPSHEDEQPDPIWMLSQSQMVKALAHYPGTQSAKRKVGKLFHEFFLLAHGQRETFVTELNKSWEMINRK